MKPTIALYGIKDQGLHAGPWWTHDHGAACMADGKVQWAFELERITAKKHDNRLGSFIETLIADLGPYKLPDEYELIVVDSFTGRTFLSDNGLWRCETGLEDLPHGVPFRKGVGAVGSDPLNKVDCQYCFQELAHIGSNLLFTGEFSDSSLLVHMDGGATCSSNSAFSFNNGRINYVHHGWEIVWAAMNFGWNDLIAEILGLTEDTRLAGPGRLMGYAAYGQPKQDLHDWLKQHDWFRYHWKNPQSFFEEAIRRFGWNQKSFDQSDSFLMDIAACCQKELEIQVIEYLQRMQKSTSAKTLYASGGVFLNITLNRKIENSGIFEKIFIPPCCSDSGLALGAAALRQYLGGEKLLSHSPFLNTCVESVPVNFGIELNIEILAEIIARGEVVAFVQGNAEVGPRALGHRSLLASPAKEETKRHLSESIKHREWYRPVAPLVLKDYAEELFPGILNSNLAPWMLTAIPCSELAKHEYPGIVHVDQSARAQVIDRRDPEHKVLVRLLDCLGIKHGLKCLMNTSFNDSGKPIVHSPTAAIEAAKKLKVAALVIGNRMELYPKNMVTLERQTTDDSSF